jgi:hypothetical protein
LNPLTKPFEYLTLNGKLRLYALRDCADQLRRLHGISIYIANRERMNDIYVVTARAKDRQGREDESTGAVPLGNLRGDALANALMKAETKAKRRVTLSIAGLGWLDETELETISQSSSTVGLPQEPPTEAHPNADQINALVELARSCGVDLVNFGHHMRRLMDLPEETKITRKFLRESMTTLQYDSAWQHYNAVLKRHVEEDVLDVPPPGERSLWGEDPVSSSHAEVERQADSLEPVVAANVPAKGPYATPQQIARLKHLAQRVGDDAYADVQDMLEHHKEGLSVEVYEVVKERLKSRTTARKQEPPTER